MKDPDGNNELKRMIGAPASEFVLHRASMLFLGRLIDIGEDFATCEWRIEDDFDLNIPGTGVPSYTGVEYMAQCIAVHAGAMARSRGLLPPLGFLLGTRHYKCSVDYFQPGIMYHATCKEQVRGSDGMGSFICRILSKDVSVAQARLAVFEVPQETNPDE